MVSVNPVASNGVYASQLNKTDQEKTKSLNQVASGKSINKAYDNAAGLAVATQLLSDVSSLRQSSTNLLQGTALLQTADNSLEQTGNILNRMKELSTQASSGSVDANSRSAINDEYQNLKSELDNLSSTTTFNGQKLVDGSYNNNFQAGASGSDVINADLTAIDSSAAGLGLTAGVGGNAAALSTQASAEATSAELDGAIDKLASYRSDVGAVQSSFSTRAEVVDDTAENTISAESAIMDADLGKAMSEFQNSNLVNEMSLAAAAQGNKMASSMLKLVR